MLVPLSFQINIKLSISHLLGQVVKVYYGGVPAASIDDRGEIGGIPIDCEGTNRRNATLGMPTRAAVSGVKSV